MHTFYLIHNDHSVSSWLLFLISKEHQWHQLLLLVKKWIDWDLFLCFFFVLCIFQCKSSKMIPTKILDCTQFTNNNFHNHIPIFVISDFRICLLQALSDSHVWHYNWKKPTRSFWSWVSWSFYCREEKQFGFFLSFWSLCITKVFFLILFLFILD